ncbi:MAG: mechanosensitive ion channel family protein [Verrucomicrobiota bacterium]
MKIRLYSWLLFMGVLVLMLNGAQAQTTTNVVAKTVTPFPESPTMGNSFGFWLENVQCLQTSFLNIPLWQYLASIIYIGLTILMVMAVDYLFKTIVERRALEGQNEVRDRMIHLLRGPIKMVCFIILLHVGLNVFNYPHWVDHYVSVGLKIVLAWSITYMFTRAVDMFVLYLRKKYQGDGDGFDAQLFPTFGKALKWAIVVVAVLMTLQNLDINVTSILASLSIGGLAFGLAAQDTIANLFGAVSIALDKPFKVGDVVKLQDLEGVVERIGLRSTRIRNWEGHLVSVPNKTMMNAIITNITRRPNVQKIVTYALPYQTPLLKLKQAMTILEDTYRRCNIVEDMSIGFTEFSDSAIIVKVILNCKETDGKTFTAAIHDTNLAIKQKFDQQMIELAFPTQMHLVKHIGGA